MKRAAFLLIAGSGLAVALAGFLFVRDPIRPPPGFRQVRESFRISEARLLDRNGNVIHELRVDDGIRSLDWVSLGAVSPAFINAVIRSEDRRFAGHRGVDWIALASAGKEALLHGGRRGASTVTMQLASMLDNTSRRGAALRTFRRKSVQIRQALALERNWSKAEILEAYLNLVTFRGELRGIHAASRGLFGKDPGGLNDSESLVLASLIRSPNAAPSDVAERAQRLAQALGQNVSRGALEELVRETLLRPYAIVPRVALAPHVARLLLSKGADNVVSTLDANLQRFAAESLSRQVLSLKDRHVRDGAVLVAANRTGEILAYVGNAGVHSSAMYVDGARAPRQAGSTLKPFLYGLALDRRLLTAASILDDSPLDVPTRAGSYAPRNYDREYRGLVSLRTALAASLNVPAVRTLLLLPRDSFADRLRLMGFTGVGTGDDHGASLALGTADVTLSELVNAYRTLANGGRWSPMTILPGADPGGRRRVLSREAAFIVSDILADRGAREATFGFENILATPFRAAVKTGTSKDMRDNWCVGFSRDYTVGVWVGNFPGEPMWNVSGMTGAAPVWAEITAYLHRGRSEEASKPPPGVVAQHVAFPGGVEDERTEWFISGTEPSRPSLALGSNPVPRIRFPSEGMIVALDPDIPEGRQLLFFEARHAGGYRYVLDGLTIGAPDRLVPWRPEPGSHVLSLVDEKGGVADSVAFSVRGRFPAEITK
jgi:penicillin-binding protein 1C